MTIILEKAFFLPVNSTFFFFPFRYIICSVTTYTSFPFTILWWWSCFLLRMLKFKREISLFFTPKSSPLLYMCIPVFCLSLITVGSLSSSLRMNFLHFYTLIAFHPQRMWPKMKDCNFHEYFFFYECISVYIYIQILSKYVCFFSSFPPKSCILTL